MDSKDKNILFDLIINCRTTYQEMASKYEISANAIKKRINNMLSKGIIKDYYIELSLKMVNAEMSMSLIYTDGTEVIDFTDKLGADPRVNTVGKASGSIYIVFAIYTNGSSGLSELGSFYRSFPSVTKVELHPLLYGLGESIKLSHTEITILKYLVENPRISISEISKKSEIPSQTINKSLKFIIESRVVNFSVHINPNAGDWITFIARIHWNEQKGQLNDLLQWLQEKFPNEYFIPAGISAVNPLVFVAFSVNELKMVTEISEEIKKSELVSSVITILGEPSRTYPDLRTIKLKELISEAIP